MRFSLTLLFVTWGLVASGCTPTQNVGGPPVATGSSTAAGTTGGGSGFGSTGDTCTPDCAGKQCGTDNCGGVCGSCTDGLTCDASGQCTTATTSGCTPNCLNKVCGDDGCGTLCGKCAPGQACTEQGQCTGGTGSCGTIDTIGECQQNNTVAVTCEAGNVIVEVCNAATGHVCAFNEFKNKYGCIKPPCTPSCLGKHCGSDGCGGLCGQCPPGQLCNAANKCDSGAGCQPNCTGVQCGPNGCGGQCGSCPNGTVCNGIGLCISPEGCTPNCAGKLCGPNGCGGSCGTCQPDEQCGANFACVSTNCVPNCTDRECGPNGCGGLCGLCPEAQSCDPGGHCVTIAGGNCGDLPYEGGCSNNSTVLSWCENGAIKVQDCSAYGPTVTCAWDETSDSYWCLEKCVAACVYKECGDNGCGQSCGTCGAGKSCNELGQCKASAGGGECGDVSYEGVCNGNVLAFCANESLFETNCGTYGKLCQWDAEGNNGNGWFACVNSDTGCTPNCIVTVDNQSLPKECGDDGCGNACGVCESNQVCDEGLCINTGTGNNCNGVPDTGQCNGNVLNFCANGQLQTENCAASGKLCGSLPPPLSGYACIEDSSSNNCNGISASGLCNGNVYTYCDAGELKTQNCSATGQTCGFLQAISGYGCTGSTNSGNNCGNEVTAAGLCVNNYWVACSGGTIQEFNCSEMGLYCMYAPDLAKYQCMANPGCEGLCPSNQRCQQDGTCGCDGIDVNGVCEANSLVWCSGGTTLTTANCAANGDTCEVNAGGFADCTSPPVTDNCNGVTAAGVCNGNQLSTCSNGVLTTTNCAAQGKICGSTPPPSVAYACIDDPNADDCNGISAAGTCVGNVFTYCENGSLSTQDCGATGQTCGQSPPPVAAYGCQGTPSSGGCGNEVTAKGLCIGNSVVACSSDNVTSFDCSEVGAYCMYDPALEKYQCLGPQGCENSCPANQRCEKGGTCGCDGITVDGVCENNTLVWCGGSTLVIEDCASSGETCKVDNTSYASCQP